MIRILHVVTIMNRGGIETMLMNHYRHLDRNRFQFDFLVHRSEEGAFDEEIRALGGRIYRVQPLIPHRLFSYLAELKAFFASHPEYAIIHSPLDTLSTFPLWAAKRASVPIRIAHSHNTSYKKITFGAFIRASCSLSRG